MFIPLIIALLLGLVTPTTHNTNCNGGGTVYVSSDDPNPGDDPGDDGEDDGTPPGDGPGPSGDNGQLPPPKP